MEKKNSTKSDVGNALKSTIPAIARTVVSALASVIIMPTINKPKKIIIMKIKYFITKEGTEISSWGCFASCCWRFATGSQGQI